MQFEFLGYKIKKAEDALPEVVVSPANTDGATVVDSNMAGYFSASLDLDGTFKTDNEQIAKYRSVSFYSACDSAIDEIVNEIVVTEDGSSEIDLNLDDVKLSQSIKDKIIVEFKYITKLLDFKHNSYDIVRDWYIDGKLFYYIIIDTDKPKDGILELRWIDPRKIKKIKNIRKKKLQSGVEVVDNIDEFYIYNDKGISEGSNVGVKLNKDSVVMCPCGTVDKTTGRVVGYLHKALKPVNSLKYIEDASVIYTITRAPMKRIFYVDVGNMPKPKAEQYVNDLMAKYRNKIVYDAATGEVKDDKKHASILDDYWMPRREGNRGTEITTLEGGQSLITSDLLDYFQKDLLNSLNVPLSRLRQDSTTFNIGRSSEITRDEIKFSKFIDRLRGKLSYLFTELLKTQLISKGIMTLDNWEEFKTDLKYDFKKDNLYAEMKENDILMQRLNSLQIIDQYVGKYYSPDWVRKHVLKQTDEDIAEIDKSKEDDRKAELDAAEHQGKIQQTINGEPK